MAQERPIIDVVEFGAKLLLHRALTEFEPPVLNRICVKPANAGVVTGALRKTGHDQFVRFAVRKSRSAILAAARAYLTGLDRERLVVAFGRGHGSGARFDGFWLGHGDSATVCFTPVVLDAIDKHLRVDDGEVLVVHNHPANDFKNFLSGLFGWRPLPSSGDREVALSHNLRTWAEWWRLGRAVQFRWYLVDEGDIAEFYLPSIERWLALFEGLRRHSSDELA